MGASQRRKGASFEREVAHVLGAKRNIGQARDGGDDITVGPFRVECKRRHTVGPMAGWMAQCVASCKRDGDIPVVIARGDGGEAYAIVRLTDFVPLMRRVEPSIPLPIVQGDGTP
jgi:hypothetical protein